MTESGWWKETPILKRQVIAVPAECTASVRLHFILGYGPGLVGEETFVVCRSFVSTGQTGRGTVKLDKGR